MAALVAGASLAHGALTVYEGFDYTSSGPIAGASGGTGFGGNWTNGMFTDNSSWGITSESLRYGRLATSGNAVVRLKPANQTSITRNLSSTVGGTGGVWVSFLIKGLGGQRFDGLSTFKDGVEGAFIGNLTNKPGVRLYSGAGRPVNNGNTDLAIRPPSQESDTNMFVMHFGGGSNNPVHRAWINPDLDSLGLGIAPTVNDGGTFGSVSTNTNSYEFNRIRLGVFTTGATQNVMVDEIRIGNSWADVSPTIPEPSTHLMFGLAGAAIVSFRRRKQHG